ncbi:hypothetical protein PIROE2DRAFT_26878, partial [Piromyces sp. E2]
NNYYYPSSAGKGINIYIIDSGIKLDHSDFDTYEGTNYNQHGMMAASVSGGKIFGAAKKANIHMISVDNFYSSIYVALDYIKNKEEKNPHKTVISISLGSYHEYDFIFQYKINELTNAGIIIFASAGNENSKLIKDYQNFYYFGDYDNVITVGATAKTSEFTNFGEYVDIYGPGYVLTEFLVNGSVYSYRNYGTSFASPLIAGVIATIMS